MGIGNPLRGDDGIGIQVLEMLRMSDLPDDVILLDAGTPGIGLVNHLQDWWQTGGGQVTLVDAVCMGQIPGYWCRFSPKDVRFVSTAEPLSLHHIDLANSLALAEAIGVLPENIVIYGVEPACMDWKLGLSTPVSACLPGLVQNILSDLMEIRI